MAIYELSAAELDIVSAGTYYPKDYHKKNDNNKYGDKHYKENNKYGDKHNNNYDDKKGRYG